MTSPIDSAFEAWLAAHPNLWRTPITHAFRAGYLAASKAAAEACKTRASSHVDHHDFAHAGCWQQEATACARAIEAMVEEEKHGLG